MILMKIKINKYNLFELFLGVIPLIFWIYSGVYINKSTEALRDKYTIIKNIERDYFSVNYDFNRGIEYVQVKARPSSWVSINEISYFLKAAIIVSEDGRFHSHQGYDIEQLVKVIYESVNLNRKKMRGASTITQQLIKNILLTKKKTYSRKAEELIWAIVLENHASKNKIFETYLNVIEYGPGIYGIKSASKYYFNKIPRDLSPKEAAFLAMLLPSPKRYNKSFKEKMLSPFASNMIELILYKMKTYGALSESDLLKASLDHLSFEKNVEYVDEAKSIQSSIIQDQEESEDAE
jgi:monofunctional biosynthetic peptidoglycan transglycosylase